MAAKELKNTLPEHVMKFGLMGVALASSFVAIEALTTVGIALFIARTGILMSLGGAAIWGIRKLGTLFPKKEAA